MAKKVYRTEIAARRRRFRALYLGTIIVLAIAALVIAALLILLKAPFFKIRSVDIEGVTYIPTDNVDTLLKGRIAGDSWIKNFLGERNILIWPSSIKAADLKYLPEAQNITIHKSYANHSVTALVAERSREGIWCFRQSVPAACFWFDKQGIVSKAPATEGSLILSVNDYSRSGIGYNEPLLPPDMLEELFSVFTALRQIDVAPKEIRLNDAALKEVQVPTYGGPTLEFSLQFPAANAPAAFKKLAAKTPIANLEYIDFRIENRIYYK